MPAEEWRPVPGWPAYEASSAGRVRKDGRPLRVLPHGQGYLRVRIGGAYHLVHRVVCLAFHGEPPAGRPCVAHGDGRRSRNTPDNLRWASHAENSADRYRPGTAGQKLSTDDAAAIRRARAAGRTVVDIARQFGVTHQTVSQIAAGVTWPAPGAA